MKHLSFPDLPGLRSRLYAAVLLCVLCLPATAAAQAVLVTSNADSGQGSLREAIATAVAGDTIRFGVTGVIALSNEILIGKNLHIQGPGAALLALSGRDSSRIFVLGATDTVRLSGLTLRNGSAAYSAIPAGGAISNEGFLRIDSCVFYHNRAISGGAVENVGGMGGNVRLELFDCTFYNNYATLPSNLAIFKAGGAITSNGRQGGTARIFARNCTFSGNESAQSGGAIFLIGDPAGGVSFEGINCTITANKANGGGGIDNAQAEAVRLKNTLLAGNFGKPIQPDMFGALISLGHNVIGDTGSVNYQGLPSDLLQVDARIGPLANNGRGLPTHSLMCGSPAIDAGDGAAAPLLDQRGQARIGAPDIGAFERNDVLDIRVNQLGDTGAGSLRQALLLACPGASLDLGALSGTVSLTSPLRLFQDVTIRGNSGAPLQLDGNDSVRILEIAAGVEADISWLTFARGYSELFGGGAMQNRGNTTLRYCTFAYNRAASGGAVANYGEGAAANLTMENCSFGHNAATPLDGGAIDNRTFSHTATASLVHCTLAHNTAENKGGGVYNGENATLTLLNTLLWNNAAPQGRELFDESAGGLVSLGHNLIGDHAGSVYAADTTGTDLTGQNPLLSPLSFYGGPTMTFRLNEGSPAIDAGDNGSAGALDQRGEARIFNGITDIGAYEYDPATRIAQVHAQPALRFFPNPTRETLYLIPDSSPEPATLRLFSSQQQVVFEQKIPASRTQATLELRLPALPPGLYIIRYETISGLRYGKLVIW